MSAVNWYPGHMHKASKAMRLRLPQVDIVIEIIDARIPFSSKNPMLATMREDKPCINVLSKCDLADPVLTKKWQNYLEKQQGIKTIAVTSSQPEKMRGLLRLCRNMIPAKSASIEAMIMGIPNVGKSTLINILAGRVVARTANEPTVTRSQQQIKLDQGITLLDTPGVLWPKLASEDRGYRLAVTGAIKEKAIHNDEIAIYAIDYLRRMYPNALKVRYRLNELVEDGQTLLAMIGAKRRCLGVGGIVDLNRAARIVLTEFRDGAIGRITLETPEMIT